MSDRNETNALWRQVHADVRTMRHERALRDDDRIRQWEAEGKIGALSVDQNGYCWRLWNPKDESDWLDIWLTTGTIVRGRVRTRETKVGLANALRLLDIEITGYNAFAEKKKR